MIAGLFVGGRGTRMGCAAKGMLAHPRGGTIAAQLAAVLAAEGLEVVLVGNADAYAELGLEALPDDPPGIGPLGGLAALLARGERAIAVACDMPYVTRGLVRRLIGAPDAAIVAPRRGGRWEPLFARYDAAVLAICRRRIAAGKHALQGLLDEAGAVELPLAPDEAQHLRDWDTPDDARG